MNEAALSELEMAFLEHRLRYLRTVHPSGKLGSALAPNFLRLIEADHWSFLTSLSSLYVMRETYSPKRDFSIADAVQGRGDFDHDQSDEDADLGWDEDDDDDEATDEHFYKEEESEIEEKTTDTTAIKGGAGSYTSDDTRATGLRS